MDKITPIFKKESLEILSTEFVTPENLSINWQGVSSSNDSAGTEWFTRFFLEEKVDQEQLVLETITIQTR